MLVFFCLVFFFFFFNDTATTEIYTLSLHDALPIFIPFSVGVRLRECFASLAMTNPGCHCEERASATTQSRAGVTPTPTCYNRANSPSRRPPCPTPSPSSAKRGAPGRRFPGRGDLPDDHRRRYRRRTADP